MDKFYNYNILRIIYDCNDYMIILENKHDKDFSVRHYNYTKIEK